jgi:hypothetical protein
LKSIHLTGAEEAFWDDGEASGEQWRDALFTIANFEEVLKNRYISLSPTRWRGQLEERTAALEHNEIVGFNSLKPLVLPAIHLIDACPSAVPSDPHTSCRAITQCRSGHAIVNIVARLSPYRYDARFSFS